MWTTGSWDVPATVSQYLCKWQRRWQATSHRWGIGSFDIAAPKQNEKNGVNIKRSLGRLLFVITLRKPAPILINIAEKISSTVSRPVWIGLVIFFIHNACGVFCMVSYAGKIFAQSGATIDPNKAAMIVAAIPLTGTIVASLLVERAGRKVRFDFSSTLQ